MRCVEHRETETEDRETEGLLLGIKVTGGMTWFHDRTTEIVW